MARTIGAGYEDARRAAASCLVAAACFVVGGAQGGGSGAVILTKRQLDCPRHASARPLAMSIVSAELERGLDRLDRSDRRFRRHLVVETVWLADIAFKLPQVEAFVAAAARSCGAQTARSSWAAVVVFPDVHLPGATLVFFIAHEGRRWYVYPAAGQEIRHG